MACLLEMRDIVKDFGTLRANDHVNLQIEEGEIHALLGENGAGKSTLMNILYGLYHPTSGTILFRGKPVKLNSPQDAINLGIGMVHQHFMLVPALTVVENIILGMPRRWGLVDLKTAAQEIQEVSRSYGYEIDPFAKVWQLSVGEQQRVEIIKALYRGARLLILDEPTAVLTPQEVRELFRVIRRLAEDKYTVIFISHKLNEVMELCTRVTVLRSGKVVGTVNTCDTTKEELARMMVGREVFFKLDKEPPRLGDVVLELDKVEALNEKGLKALKNLSLQVRAGEILGIAGVDGNGQSELAQVITGMRKPVAGRIRLKGRDVTGMGPRFIYEQKVAHIPEDRQAEGLVMDMTIKENLILR
ncbi:MAG: ABC transporter ATP-binding protein, partial [Thermoanaerobacteraceae bacterium]|nr:ABC transporter ATP-binding protein [Thermoanaerobacteraceae bacterium]